MNKFIKKGILFFILIIIVDSAFGLLFGYISMNAKSGGNLKNNHIAYEMNEELLIMGSSRAAHHYKPDVFSDSLKMSCFNCGRDGNGIILMYGRYKLLKERYTPKVIIYDITGTFDLEENDNIKYLGDLKKYFNNREIKKIFKDISLREYIKMNSKMYINNSTVINTISNFLLHENDNSNGYLPMYKKMEIIPKEKSGTDEVKPEFDKIKLAYLEKPIQECQGETQLFFIVSPYFFESKDTTIYTPIKQLCSQYDIPFIEYDNKQFIRNKDLFSDSSHLNDKGATKYSQIIAQQIKEYLSNQY